MTTNNYISPIGCEHNDEERLARDKNGNPILYRQCVLCGKRVTDPIALTPTHRKHLDSIPAYDRDRALEVRRLEGRPRQALSGKRTREEQLLNEPRKDYISIYILLLEGQRVYVGQAVDPHQRVKDHFAGKGSAWTQMHKPKQVLDIRKTNTRNWKLAEDIENEVVISLMGLYGWTRVRGGYWSNTSEEDIRRSLSAHGYLEKLASAGQQEAGCDT
jgi:predicted GIY-YIG superfamily endonuclease